VIAPDFIGYGQNPIWEGDTFHFEEDVDVAEALLAHAGEPAHVMGHSYGGMIALGLARRAPSKVLSLGLYDPVAFGVLHSRQDRPGLDELGSFGPGFLDPSRGGDESWMGQFIDYWNGPGYFADLPPEPRASLVSRGRRTFFEVRALLLDRTPHEAYLPIASPTFLMTGDKSPIAAQRIVSILSEVLPNARRQVLEGANHMAPVFEPSRVDALFAEHLERYARVA
jgi:pimeloyl-ACP methyl ester carboxylesterase